MARNKNVTFAGYTNSDDFRCLENLQRSSIELYLAYCGREKNEAGSRFDSPLRHNHVLHFVLGGKGKFWMGGKEWSLEEGSIFYIPPGTRASYAADENDPWKYAWIGFNGMRAEEYTETAGFSVDLPVRFTERVDRIDDKIRQMLDAYVPSVSNELMREAMLLQVFSILIEEREITDSDYEQPAEAHPDFVLHALDYITHHFDKNIKISSLANHLGVSRSYLSSSFRKAVGCSPQNYILNLRMERAASLLRTTTLPVNVISITVGYPDQLAFSKIFKQYYGTSPSEFRKSGQEVKLFNRKGDFSDFIL